MESITLHFIRPAWLLALPLAWLLPWAWRRLRRPSGDWARVCDPHLLRWLGVGQANTRARGTGAWWSGLLLAIATLSLAGPSWEQLPDSSFSARDARVVALDLSASMLAEDLKPNRLTQARFRLSDMLQQTREGQVGLIAFAGDAYVVSPLTADMNTIANMLPALQPDIMPVSGSRADRALVMAAELLQRAGQPGGEVLLITDSATAADIETAGRLARQGVRTSVLAVGTVDGAPIPSGSGFVSDERGAVVIARLNVDTLERLAEAGGGRLSLLQAGGEARDPWAETEGRAFARRDDTMGERWKDAGPWLVLLLLPMMAAGFRRGLLFSLSVVVLPGLLASPTAQAGLWDDLWQRRDQQAQQALAESDTDSAALLAEDPGIAGEAWYRGGDYQRAAEAWSGLQSASDHYNRGNALARAGNLDAALAAYDAALAIDSGMEDALFNRALVEQLKEQQQQQQQEQDGEGEQGESSEEQGESQPQEGQQGEEEGQAEQQPEEGEGQQQEGQQDLEAAWSEEDAQAMEQWLRRIPDDPGGLLRRKFRSQHQNRGAPPDEDRTW
jgi:Ca-activated chloride channel family protein